MATTAGGAPVDGVLRLDQVALRDLLRVTGPVTVDGVEVTADTVIPFLGNTQYSLFPDSDDRRDLLAGVASEVVAALTATNADPLDVVNALRASAQGRHLQAWSPHADQQAAWARLGIDGTMGRPI